MSTSDGARVRTTEVTGPGGRTEVRTATRGHGTTTIERADGASRVTTRAHR